MRVDLAGWAVIALGLVSRSASAECEPRVELSGDPGLVAEVRSMLSGVVAVQLGAPRPSCTALSVVLALRPSGIELTFGGGDVRTIGSSRSAALLIEARASSAIEARRARDEAPQVESTPFRMPLLFAGGVEGSATQVGSLAIGPTLAIGVHLGHLSVTTFARVAIAPERYDLGLTQQLEYSLLLKLGYDLWIFEALALTPYLAGGIGLDSVGRSIPSFERKEQLDPRLEAGLEAHLPLAESVELELGLRFGVRRDLSPYLDYTRAPPAPGDELGLEHGLLSARFGVGLRVRL